MLIKELIEKSGVKPTDDVSTICNGFKEAISNGYSFDGLTGKGITWSADGEPNKAPSVVIIKDGVYQQL